MKITQDEEFGKDLKKMIADYIESTKRGDDGLYHVSSLLNPMEAYWNHVNGQPPITDTQVGFFIPGIAFHELFQKIMGEELAEQPVSLGKDIVGTVDMVGAYFSEIKTSRKWSVPKEPNDTYVEQFLSYLAMADKDFGHIIVVYFTAGRTWSGKTPSTLEIRAWKVETTEEDREEQRQLLTDTRNNLEMAKKTNDPSSLPFCWDFKCGFKRTTGSIKRGDKKEEVLSLCPHYYDCKPEGQYPIENLGRKTKKGFMAK